MKKLVVIIAFLFIMDVHASVKEVTLDKCVDGDTAYFIIDNESKKFRFLALDTPESVHPTKGEEAYGKSASEYTCDLLKNANSIVVEYDDGSNKADKYKRELAWIWVDNKLLQQTIIENGYGQVAYIYGDYKYTKNLCAVQKNAINQQVNIWSDPEYKEGYCAKIDTTGVSTTITMDTTPESSNNDKNVQDMIIYIAAGIIVIISAVTGKKLNLKKIKI